LFAPTMINITVNKTLFIVVIQLIT